MRGLWLLTRCLSWPMSRSLPWMCLCGRKYLICWKDLQENLGLTILFIAHDLSTVRFLCGRIAVMYLGKIVEMGPAESVFYNPRHPYTQVLLSAVMVPDPARRRRRIILKGEVPSPVDPPPGCRFHTRCPHSTEQCRLVEPELKDVATGGHMVSCHANQSLYMP